MNIYENHYRSVAAPNGSRTNLSLGFFSEGLIKKIVIRQVGGEYNPFSVDVYNSKKAFNADSSSGGSATGGDYAMDPESYRVFPSASGSSGEYLTISDEYGRLFKNQDGPLSDRKRKIYLSIQPQGSGDATWDITISGWSDVG